MNLIFVKQSPTMHSCILRATKIEHLFKRGNLLTMISLFCLASGRINCQKEEMTVLKRHDHHFPYLARAAARTGPTISSRLNYTQKQDNRMLS